MCRSKNAGVAGYAEAFRPVQSDLQTSEWYSYFENDVLVLKAHVYAVWIGLAETRTKASAGKTPGAVSYTHLFPSVKMPMKQQIFLGLK